MMRDNSRIRVFPQTRHSTAIPQFKTFPAQWLTSTSDNRKHWSAVGLLVCRQPAKKIGGAGETSFIPPKPGFCDLPPKANF